MSDDDREYVAEMLAAIDAAVPSSDYVSALIASDLVDKLRVNDPEMLAGFLDSQAVRVVSLWITRRSQSARSLAYHRREPSVFAGEAERFEESGHGSFTCLDAEYVIDLDNTRRVMADMSGADHLFVADNYRGSAASSLMLEAFHRAVAKRVGKKRTGDVFTAEQIDGLRRSILGRQPIDQQTLVP